MFTVLYDWEKDPDQDEYLIQRFNLTTNSVEKGHEWPFATVTEFTDEPGKFVARILVRSDSEDGIGAIFPTLDEAKRWVEEFLFAGGDPQT